MYRTVFCTWWEKARVGNMYTSFHVYIETCILSYVKQIASPGLMHETGCSGLCTGMTPEGWDGEGGRMGVQDREHMYTHG